MLDSHDEGSGVSAQRKLIHVGIGAIVLSDDRRAVLSAHALGSSVALLAYEPRRRVGGVLHYLLPSSTLSRDDVGHRPGLFADTGITVLLETLGARGCASRNLVLKAAGGARAFEADSFDVGDRNILALYAGLAHRRLALAADALGGRDARTVRLHIGSGSVRVRSHLTNQQREL